MLVNSSDAAQSNIDSWVRTTLVEDGLVVNVHREKHNFKPRDLTRILVTFWTKNDLIYIHERYRIQFRVIIRVYCLTGARLSAFFTGGLRYRDIELVLQRMPEGGWRLIYRIDQRWVKNNRDPENIVYGTAGREHEKLIYDDSGSLLTMAIADGALFGYGTLDDVRAQEIPPGQNELSLRFRDEVLERPILRKCTLAEGVTDESMPKAAFSRIYRAALRNAGYFCGSSI